MFLSDAKTAFQNYKNSKNVASSDLDATRNIIRLSRKGLCVSRKKLADLIGVSEMSIFRLEEGGSVSDEMFETVIEALERIQDENTSNRSRNQ